MSANEPAAAAAAVAAAVDCLAIASKSLLTESIGELSAIIDSLVCGLTVGVEEDLDDGAGADLGCTSGLHVVC